MTIEAGDRSLRLDYPGPNHAEGNVFIYAPQQRVLMLVDVIFPGWVPFSNLALSADVPGFIKAHEQALDYDFDTLVGGHVTRPGTPRTSGRSSARTSTPSQPRPPTRLCLRGRTGSVGRTCSPCRTVGDGRVPAAGP